MSERFRNVHRSVPAPEFGVGPIGQMVVHDNEVTDVPKLGGHLIVELGAITLLDSTIGKELHEPNDASLNEMDAGGFHRFNEAGREANGDAVFYPVLLTLSRLKANDPGVSDRLTSDLGEK